MAYGLWCAVRRPGYAALERLSSEKTQALCTMAPDSDNVQHNPWSHFTESGQSGQTKHRVAKGLTATGFSSKKTNCDPASQAKADQDRRHFRRIHADRWRIVRR
eukprot:7385478-Prymnesium_polylepis.1